MTRYEQAFDALGIKFSRARPARLLLRAASQNPDALIPAQTRARFERLFQVIAEKIAALTA